MKTRVFRCTRGHEWHIDWRTPDNCGFIMFNQDGYSPPLCLRCIRDLLLAHPDVGRVEEVLGPDTRAAEEQA